VIKIFSSSTRARVLWVAFGLLTLALPASAASLGLGAGVPTGAIAAAGAAKPTLDALGLTKQAYEDRYAAARATAREQDHSASIPPPSMPTHAPVLPQPRTQAGAGTIIETGLAPYPGSIYRFENRWVMETPARAIVVYAGSWVADPAQGLVIVDSSPRGVGGAFPTPTNSGAVRVVDADGQRLTLVAVDGTTFVFDVAALAFAAR
jgi:hypothetical protein